MKSVVSCQELKWVTLAFTLAWFGLVMPGHQRGIVTLPEAQSPSKEAAQSNIGRPMCAMCVQQGDDTTSDDTAPSTPKSPGGSCAICFLKMGLNLPPQPVTLHLQTWLLDELEYLEVTSQIQATPVRTFRLGRAPPCA